MLHWAPGIPSACTASRGDAGVLCGPEPHWLRTPCLYRHARGGRGITREPVRHRPYPTTLALCRGGLVGSVGAAFGWVPHPPGGLEGERVSEGLKRIREDISTPTTSEPPCGPRSMRTEPRSGPTSSSGSTSTSLSSASTGVLGASAVFGARHRLPRHEPLVRQPGVEVQREEGLQHQGLKVRREPLVRQPGVEARRGEGSQRQEAEG